MLDHGSTKAQSKGSDISFGKGNRLRAYCARLSTVTTNVSCSVVLLKSHAFNALLTINRS